MCILEFLTFLSEKISKLKIIAPNNKNIIVDLLDSIK